ncbi:MAG: acyl-ACP thioesterase [Gammaproteobacteria bacterium]|jgi:acyl-ACP thioesterase
MTVGDWHESVARCDTCHDHRMAVVPGASELLDPPEVGRQFRADRKVRLGDVDPSGQLRLDATARYLQDIAGDDASGAELDGAWGWVVRRSMIEVRQPAVLDEVVTVTTYCTGVGRSWAERTTILAGSLGADIATVSVWVQVAADTGRPAALTQQFVDTYGSACGGRKVSARLTLAAPTDSDGAIPWSVRRADLDPFEHVNNAANWAFVEESLNGMGPRRGRAEMEFVGPVMHGTNVQSVTESTDGVRSMWLLNEGSVLSAARWSPVD